MIILTAVLRVFYRLLRVGQLGYELSRVSQVQINDLSARQSRRAAAAAAHSHDEIEMTAPSTEE
jgi:hypothetical protein